MHFLHSLITLNNVLFPCFLTGHGMLMEACINIECKLVALTWHRDLSARNRKMSTHEDCEARDDCCLITHQVSAVAHKHSDGLRLLFLFDTCLFKAPSPLTGTHLNGKLSDANVASRNSH